jgi:hypothetical protein
MVCLCLASCWSFVHHGELLLNLSHFQSKTQELDLLSCLRVVSVDTYPDSKVVSANVPKAIL